MAISQDRMLQLLQACEHYKRLSDYMMKTLEEALRAKVSSDQKLEALRGIFNSIRVDPKVQETFVKENAHFLKYAAYNTKRRDNARRRSVEVVHGFGDAAFNPGDFAFKPIPHLKADLSENETVDPAEFLAGTIPRPNKFPNAHEMIAWKEASGHFDGMTSEEVIAAQRLWTEHFEKTGLVLGE